MNFSAEHPLCRPEQELHERLWEVSLLVVQEVGHPCPSETEPTWSEPKYTLPKPQLSANTKISFLWKAEWNFIRPKLPVWNLATRKQNLILFSQQV